MTEAEAREWIDAQFGVSRGTLVARFAAALVAESARQNLVSQASLQTVWRRHIVDSAQLLEHAASSPGDWIDIGTGAGFPGLIVALLSDRSMMLVEPRKKRAAFLAEMVESLGVGKRVEVLPVRIETVRAKAAVISARAVAALPELLASAAHLSSAKTIWLLPKGQSAPEEVAAARLTWHGMFHVEQSITQDTSRIIIAKGVARR